MGYSPRYHVGYVRPVKGAFGDSPKEWRTVSETDELNVAYACLVSIRIDHPDAVIWDTETNLELEGKS